MKEKIPISDEMGMFMIYTILHFLMTTEGAAAFADHVTRMSGQPVRTDRILHNAEALHTWLGDYLLRQAEADLPSVN